MKLIASGLGVMLLLLTASATADQPNDAVEELFDRLSPGECGPTALTRGVWTINTPAAGTHGEIVLGDVLVFEQLDPGKSISRRSQFNIWKNGALWESYDGWTGSCVRDGNRSVYVVHGEVSIGGCLHELAIGRLDHDDSLGRRIEIVFRDSDESVAEQCGHFDQLHPGHAHGVG